MGKTKTYVLTLSAVFPKTHGKAGTPTNFKEKFITGQGCPDCTALQDFSDEDEYVSVCNDCGRAELLRKLHTIRTNYPLWERRVREIQEGRAVLSVRQWTGKPYRSKQAEIARLTAEDGVGIQRLRFLGSDFNGGYIRNGEFLSCEILANNDGLSKEDWQEWFKGYDLSKPMAVIHFTTFRY